MNTSVLTASFEARVCTLRPRWLVSIGPAIAGAYGLLVDELLPWTLVPLTIAAAAGCYAAMRGSAAKRRVELSHDGLVLVGKEPLSIPLREVRDVAVSAVGYSWFYPRNLIERLTGQLLQFRSLVTVTAGRRVLELVFDDPREAERFACVVRLATL